jgi:hypothetical protein
MICESCNKGFTTIQALTKHKKTACRYRDEYENESIDPYKQLNEQSAKIDELMTIVKSIVQQPVISTNVGTNSGTVADTVNNNTTNNTVNNNVVHIHPWDGPRCINIDFKMIKDIFAENEKLREFTRMGELGMADPRTAHPYVIELLMELIKRAHAEPAGRNIYLNPNRADQVLVLKKDNHWEVLPLLEATKALLDDAVSWTKLAIMSQEVLKALPIEAQSALALTGMHYEYEPEEYIKLAKASMAAHLTNCRDKVPQPGTKTVIMESPLKPPPRRPDKIIPLGPAMLRSSYEPPVAYIPRYPDPSAKPRLDDERAAKLFMRMRPAGDITIDYIKELAKAAEEDVSYTIKKLWEAVDEEHLKGEDASMALRVIAKYDEDPDVYY